MQFDPSVWHWWHPRLFLQYVYSTDLTSLVGVVALCTSEVQCVLVRGETHQRQWSEKHMNVCKFMLTEVFKWISEATLKPWLIQTAQHSTQWTTVPPNEQQQDGSGVVHILYSHCLTLYHWSRDGASTHMSDCTFKQDIVFTPPKSLRSLYWIFEVT